MNSADNARDHQPTTGCDVSAESHPRAVDPTQRGVTTKSLLIHAAALVVVLAAMSAVVLRGTGIAYPDEGLYAAQATSLARGTWSEERPAIRLPGVENLNGLGPEWTETNRYVGYVRHAVYMLVLAPFQKLWGFPGLLVPSVLAGGLAALAAALLARRLDPRLAIAALWLTGLGTPLLFDSLLIAAHALAAATTAWVAVGLAQVLLDRKPWNLLWCVPLVALTVTLRSEGVVVMGALGGAVGAVAVATCLCGGRVRTALPAIGCGALILVAAAGTYFLDAELARRITGSTAETRVLSRFEGERAYLAQVWASWFRPWYSDLEPQVLVAIGALGTATAGLFHRLARARFALGTTILLLTGSVCLLFAAFTSRSYITGLFAAAPLLATGLLLLRQSDLSNPITSVILVTATLFATTVVLTGYSEGGAAEWGGRFYAVLLPLLTPVALVGLGRLWDTTDRHLRPVGLGAAIMTSLSIAVIAVGTNAHQRELTSRFADSIEQTVRVTAVSGKPLVIIGGVNVGGASRSLWAEVDTIDTLVGPSVTATFELVNRAARVGYDRVFVATSLRQSDVRKLAKAWLDPLDWRLQDAKPIDAPGWRLYAFAPSKA